MATRYDPFDEWKFKVSGQWETWQKAAKAALEGSGQALRATMLVNGGAAVALLALLGNVIAKDNNLRSMHVSLGGMRWAMMLFLIGVASSALGYGMRWGAAYADAVAHRFALEIVSRPPHITGEHAYSDEMRSWGRWGLRATRLAALFGLLSWATFVWGGIVCYRSVW